jgi:hypothetical protein
MRAQYGSAAGMRLLQATVFRQPQTAVGGQPGRPAGRQLASSAQVFVIVTVQA